MTGITGHPWVARGLAAVGLTLLVAWVVFRAWLPWWASALMLAGATIAAIEAVFIVRKAHCDD